MCSVRNAAFQTDDLHENLSRNFGCGTGRFGHEFYKYFDHSWGYVGVDSSAASIKEAQEQLASSCQGSHGKNPPFVFALDSWNQSAAQYDFILAACASCITLSRIADH
jgi:SAM-dependent methyltransferase